MNSLREIKESRKADLLSREEYWRSFREHLREIQNFADFGITGEIKLTISKGEIIIEIPLNYSHKVQMVVNPDDIRSVPFSVLADGRYEPFHSDLIFELINQSSGFVDIGANMGYYTLAAGVLNSHLEVWCFEPNKEVFALLEKNIILNELSGKIHSHQLALGDENVNDQALFVPGFTGTGGGSFRNLHPDEGDPSVEFVTISTMDQIFMDTKQEIDLIKIDVEGFELSVINGGIKTLETYRPTIVIELLRKWMLPFGTSPNMVIDHLSEIGYISFAIGEKSLTLIENIDNSTIETNFIFVHPENTKHLSLLMKYVL